MATLKLIAERFLPKKSKAAVPKYVKCFTETLLLVFFPGASCDPEIFSAPDSNNAVAPPFFSIR
jgi:hypothetical protein